MTCIEDWLDEEDRMKKERTDIDTLSPYDRGGSLLALFFLFFA